MRQLALQYPASPLASGQLLIYLTARDKTRGEQALRDLQDDKALAQAKVLARHGGHTDIKYYPLDISKKESIATFVDELKKQHPEGIDFVVNNAAVALEGFGELLLPKISWSE